MSLTWGDEELVDAEDFRVSAASLFQQVAGDARLSTPAWALGLAAAGRGLQGLLARK